MPDPFEDASAARLFVFSHPNHEGAVLGMVQRLRPHLVFLTDGGGERRVNETRAALPEPGPGRVLRYEWRGARLRDAGLVERVITWRDHCRPTMAPLLAA
jgi:hypothetical protein